MLRAGNRYFWCIKFFRPFIRYQVGHPNLIDWHVNLMNAVIVALVPLEVIVCPRLHSGKKIIINASPQMSQLQYPLVNLEKYT